MSLFVLQQTKISTKIGKKAVHIWVCLPVCRVSYINTNDLKRFVPGWYSPESLSNWDKRPQQSPRCPKSIFITGVRQSWFILLHVTHAEPSLQFCPNPAESSKPPHTTTLSFSSNTSGNHCLPTFCISSYFQGKTLFSTGWSRFAGRGSQRIHNVVTGEALKPTDP